MDPSTHGLKLNITGLLFFNLIQETRGHSEMYDSGMIRRGNKESELLDSEGTAAFGTGLIWSVQAGDF